MVRKRQASPGSDEVGLEGMVRGFADFLSNLAEQGDGEFTREGELDVDDKKGFKAVYGLTD